MQRLLDDIDTHHPDCAAFMAPLRAWALAFESDHMTRLIQQALAHRHAD